MPSFNTVKALKFGAIIYVLFGLMAAAAAWPPFAPPMQLIAQFGFLQFDGGVSVLAKEARLLNAIMGGVIVGWGVMIWCVVDQFYEHYPQQLGRILMLSATSWFVIDGIGSVVSGGWFNAIMNIFFWALIGLPILMAKDKRETNKKAA